MSSITSFVASAASTRLSLSLSTLTESRSTAQNQETDRLNRPAGQSTDSDRNPKLPQPTRRVNPPQGLLETNLPLDSFRSLLSPSLSRPANRPDASRIDSDGRPPRRQAAGTTTDGPTSQKSLEDRIDELDPKLTAHLQALKDLLAQTNPEAAEALEKAVGTLLKHLDGFGGGDDSGASSAPQGGSSFRFESIELVLETSVTDLQIQTSDGTTITAQVVRATFTARATAVFGKSDPLVLDLNQNGVFDTTSAEDGHDFDITGDGQLERAATVANGDAFLVFDRNDNGLIDNGTELFGDQNGAVDGFAELSKFDDNSDGSIDVRDQIFPRLKLFADLNRNGQTDVGELRTLQDYAVAALLIQADRSDALSNGNEVAKVGSFLRDDGSAGQVGDLLLQYLA